MGSQEPRRGVIYGRQSLTKDGSLSREDQVRAGTAEAERHHIEIIAELIEPPSTGAYKNRGRNRPKWQELLDLVRNGKVQVVIAFKTDRLSRGGGPGWAPLIEAAESAGLDPDRFVLIVGSGFMSEFELGIRASMDREESKKTSDRVRQARTRTALEGKPSMSGRSRPFGFQADRVTHHEDEAELLRSTARRLLAGESLHAICREWNDTGVRTPNGNLWSPSWVRQMLGAPRMAGLRQHGQRENRTMRDPAIVGPAVWDPILDRATWEQLRARLYGPVRPRRRDSRYLLTGFLHCWRCGHVLYGAIPSRSAVALGARPRYYCVSQPGSSRCGRCSISAAPTEEFIVHWAHAAFRSKQFVEVLRRKNRADADIEAKEVALIEAEARLLQLAEEFGDGQIPKAEWLRMRRGAEARRDKALAAVLPLRQKVVLDGLGDIRTLPDRWPGLELDTQRAALGLVLDKVTIGPVIKQARVDDRIFIPDWTA